MTHVPNWPVMFCAGCGADRSVSNASADPGPCPTCGSTIRTSVKPGQALLGVTQPLHLTQLGPHQHSG